MKLFIHWDLEFGCLLLIKFKSAFIWIVLHLSMWIFANHQVTVEVTIEKPNMRLFMFLNILCPWLKLTSKLSIALVLIQELEDTD